MITKQTITPKRRGAKQKSGEIERFLELIAALGLERVDLAEKLDVSLRTINNSIHENTPLGAQLLRKLHLNLGASIDWLVSGKGAMFTADVAGVGEKAPVYSVNSDRLTRVQQSVSDYMANATDDEQAWLEIELRHKLKGINEQ